MTNKQNPKFQELVAKLREIFQIDRPELDFGIYRILNARASEINDYLENRLAERVQAALALGSAATTQQLQAELQEAEKSAQALGVSPDGVPKVQELRARLKDASAGSFEHENAVFSHLLAFFTRYYQDGDFISQRRYKGDTYAIPYAGEEVMLHWANKDQYYTKSSENFANYSFKLEDGRTVHFRLVAADTAKDNRKDNDKERRFALLERKTNPKGSTGAIARERANKGRVFAVWNLDRHRQQGNPLGFADHQTLAATEGREFLKPPVTVGGIVIAGKGIAHGEPRILGLESVIHAVA